MDLDGDGNTDILSGSYSYAKRGAAAVVSAMAGRPTMAGELQLLRGKAGGGYAAAAPVRGRTGATLIIRSKHLTDRICTRPFAADLDADGYLDIVAGNLSGSFALFAGTENHTFEPHSVWLERDGKPLFVAAHSDPFLIDWDEDGDLDLLSGSNAGGAFLFVNEGSRTAPRWGERRTLLAPPSKTPSYGDDELVLGDGHIVAPGKSTRIWVADVDGDGKLDLLLGDDWSLFRPAPGLDEAATHRRHAAWLAERKRLFEQEDLDSEAWSALLGEQERYLRNEGAGYVWLLRQK